MHHEIKSWPEQFQAVHTGNKKHEVRKFDRDYQPGDDITLREWNPSDEKYTGREIKAVITDVTWPGMFGLPWDIGVFSIALI